MRTCPLCAQQNPDGAGHCQWCHGSLNENPEFTTTYNGPEGTSGKAVASLICGVLFFFLPTAVAAIILGHMSHAEIRRSAGRLRGAGMALGGLILGYVGAAILPLILIVAAILVPNLLRARMAANEASAVGSLRVLNTAAETYASTYDRGFPASLKDMGPGGAPSAERAGLIDSGLASGNKSGYLFFYRPVPSADRGRATGYIINADPSVADQTGRRHFYTDQTGVIRLREDRPADAQSQPIQ